MTFGWQVDCPQSPIMMQITLFMNPETLLYLCDTITTKEMPNQACIFDLCINTAVTPSYLLVIVVQTKYGPNLHGAMEPGHTPVTAH